MTSREQLEEAIALQETMRGLLPDAVVDATLAALRAQLRTLAGAHGAEARKLVTVLFADVSGFTALAETLDAEDVRETINALWQRVDHVILDHGGTIDKHIGDAVMALWGTAESREDDPVRAIRAALAMQTAVRTFSVERGLRLNLRIGLNTGPVLLGAVGTTAEYTAMGDTVNTAARLEQAAPVGGILITHDTYVHVRGVFDVAPQAPLRVKGKNEPLQAYVVTPTMPRASRARTRGVEGVETRTIGREWELQQLQTAYETAVSRSQTTVVTLVGDAGIGKSRLLSEFERWLARHHAPAHILKGRAAQHTQGIPHYLLRGMLAARFEILDSDPLPTVRQKLAAGLAAHLTSQAEMKAHILGAWLGYDFGNSPHLQPIREEPEQIKNRATLYLAQYAAALSTGAPTVILLDDCHWADRGSLEAVVDLARRRPRLPLFILCITRPTLFERLPKWGEALPLHSRLMLSPLSGQDMRALAAEILRLADPLPADLLDLVSRRAEGNPFFAEELVKMLIDDGVIDVGAAAWRVRREPLPDTAVPATLTGVLQARLDRLQPEERQALQQAAVIGRVFWDDALAALPSKGHLALPALQAREFIFPRPDSAFSGTAEYVFKHAILRDVTYETVLKSRRRQYHALVADWLSAVAQAGGREEEYAALIGRHFEQAGKQETAAVWYGRAGRQAVANFAHEEAVRYLTLALQFTPETQVAARFALLEARETTHHLRGSRDAQRPDLAQLAALAEQLGTREQVRIALRQAHYAQATSDYATAVAHAQRTIELAQRGSDAHLVAEGHWAWGSALLRLGHHAAAIAQFEAGLRLARDSGNQKQVASCLHGLGVVALSQGDYAAASEALSQVLAIYQSQGNRYGEGASLNNLGIVANDQGAYTTAKQYHEQALAVRREIGDRNGEGGSLNNAGVVAMNQGDFISARQYFEQFLAICREIGDRYGEGASLNNLGEVAAYQGDYATASLYYEQAMAVYTEIGDRATAATNLSNLGNVALNQANLDEAKQKLEQALAVQLELGDQNMVGTSVHALGAVALAQNRLQAAARQYEQAMAMHQKLRQPHRLVEDWAGLARVKLALGDRASASQYSQKVRDYLKENPRLDGAENPMRTFRFTWEVLVTLGLTAAAEAIVLQTARMMQTYLEKNLDPTLQALYLGQPHHQILWAASEARRGGSMPAASGTEQTK